MVTLIVEDYDRAVDFFVGALGFELVEDSPSLTNDGRPKRWLVVRPPDSSAGLLLAQADGEAQARAATALVQPARAVGLRLTKRGGGELVYTPRVQFPFLLMLYHKLSGEKMTVTFAPGSDGGTHVMISGKVAGSNHLLADSRGCAGHERNRIGHGRWKAHLRSSDR